MAKNLNKEQEEPAPIIVIEKCKQHLKYVFNDADMIELAHGMARALSEQHEAEDELKAISTQIKSKIALHSGAANSASTKISTGHEYRNVECEVTKNYTTGLVTTRRLDSGEVVDTRLMTTEERQAELPLAEKVA